MVDISRVFDHRTTFLTMFNKKSIGRLMIGFDLMHAGSDQEVAQINCQFACPSIPLILTQCDYATNKTKMMLIAEEWHALDPTIGPHDHQAIGGA